MTESDERKDETPDDRSSTGTTNTATGTVGIQAEAVHDSTVYIINPGASAQEKFDKGVNFLEGGVPGRARELIDEAVAEGFPVAARVRFHWILSVLSKRSLNDLDVHVREQLRCLPDQLTGHADDGWKDALAVVNLLITEHDTADGPSALQALDSLPQRQRDMIVKHLDLVLTGAMKEHLWRATRCAAEEAQFAKGRRDRVWAYFQPTPAQPRVWVPGDDEATPLGDWLLAAASSVAFLAAIAVLGRQAVSVAQGQATVALVLIIVTAVTAAVAGYEWHRRRVQLAARDRRYTVDPKTERVTEPGFRRRVDDRFHHYEIKYPLPDPDNERMLAETRGIRATLRDEIGVIYQGFSVPAIDWLIRFHHLDVRDRWRKGTLRDYRERYRTRGRMKLACVAALALLALSLITVVLTAARDAPVSTALATVVAVVTGVLATARWLCILGDRHRRVEAAEERSRLQEARQAEYRRWTNKLAKTMPSEEEMETWLDADKTMFLAEALRTHRLTWREIVTDGWLQAPARPYRRGRRKGGQWRYSRYDLRLFLVTEDGVREVGAELDFLQGTLTGRERRNYRFDAVSSVQVTPGAKSSYALELVLTNSAQLIVVTDAAPESVDDKETFAELNLDAAGFGHTLRILEGIAAEGKSWIGRDRGRNAS